MNGRTVRRTWAAALAASVVSAAAAAGTPGVEVRPLAPDEPTVPAPRAAQEPYAMDPFMRALVIGIAASILREAAAQPDPIEGLGDAVERRIAIALADPNTMRLVEAGLREALRDAPPELREPLAQFATSMLKSLRREMLQDRNRGPYY